MKRAVCLLLLKDLVHCKEVLIVERVNDNGIGLPGGKVENDETSLDAIIREVKEETNLTLEERHLMLVYTTIVNGYYCKTYYVKPEYIISGEIDLKEIKQMEKHIIPKFVKFNNTEFVMPSVYMSYNRGLLINSDEIIKNYKEG